MPNDPNNFLPSVGGYWDSSGQWSNDQTNPNNPSYQEYQAAKQAQDQMKNDPNSPYNQAMGLQNKEQMLLGRQAPAIGQVMDAGLAGARGNQMQALGAQQQLMAGPSLAQMRGQQQFGQQRAMMGGGGANPLAARMNMLAGNQALGGMSQNIGNQVGQEMLQSQKGIAGSTNTLAQGDIQTQQGLEQLLQKQRQMYLAQRGQNLGQAQGYEQNYFNLQNAYEQSAQQTLKDKYQAQQQQQQQQQAMIGASMSAVPYVGGAGAALVKAGG